MKLLLFDLDGTLLNSRKAISFRTIAALEKCKDKGFMIGIATSRSEKNCLEFSFPINPDISVFSGGALIKVGNKYIYKAEITDEETRDIIAKARRICGEDVEITVDTINKHYWNYSVDPREIEKNWGESIYHDFVDFSEPALKICFEARKDIDAIELKKEFQDYDFIRFSDGFWYKLTKKDVTKESSLEVICKYFGITLDDIISFGDDYADIEMLKLCGKGVAMGNAIDEVKRIADVVIGENDQDGIAIFLEESYLEE